MPRGLARLVAVLLLAPCFLGVYDAVILVTCWQRLQRTAAALGAGIAAAGSLQEADFAPYFAYAEAQAQPDDVTRRGAVIVTAILSGRDGATIQWQRRIGSNLVASRYGQTGAPAQIAGGAGAISGRLIAAELVAPLSWWVIGAPWLRGLLPDVLHVAVLRRAG